VHLGEKKGCTRLARRCGSRPAPLALLVAVCVFGALACARDARVERVILITVDTLRADHVGAYGATGVRTPTLDGIAARGVRFENAISPAPLTLPTHATLLTGLDPPEHGVRHNGVFRLAEGLPTLAEALAAEGFRTGAFVGAFVLDRRFGLARGFEHYDDHTDRLSSTGGLRGFAERSADAVVDAALAWLEGVDGPFLIWVHVYDPHAEYTPPPGFAAAYPSNPYAGEIAFADAELGRLLASVRERWRDGGTLVVATSDHGESLGEHGEATHSHTVYDATQRVPLLFEGPGIAPGRTVRGVVALRDVAPTVLELVGAPPLPEASGASLASVLRRGGEPEARAAYVETLATQLDWGWSPLLGLRTARHKLIAAPRPELYDLAEDPEELHDRAAIDGERLAELEALLGEHLAGARPRGHARFDPDEADRVRLEALGYVVPTASESAVLGQVAGTDPKDRMHVIRAVHEADGLIAEGRPEAALARLDAVDGMEAEGFVVQAIVSTAALAAGHLARAEAAARAAVAAAPESRVGWQRLAAVLEARGRDEEAKEAYAAILRIDPQAGAPLTALGALAERAGDVEGAAREYRRALAAPRPDPDAAWRLAALALEGGREDEAAQHLGPELQGHGTETAEAALRLAAAERTTGRAAASMRRLRDAAREAPGDLRVRLALAEALAAGGQPEDARVLTAEALAAADRALQVAEPARRRQLELLRARALLGLGRREEARASLAATRSDAAALPWGLVEEARVLEGLLGSAGEL
jgi:choline-sulfatase